MTSLIGRFFTSVVILITLAACDDDSDIVPFDDSYIEIESSPIIMSTGIADVDGGIIGVAARRPGVVANVFVEEGDPIKKGQLLAKLDDVGTSLSVSHARSVVEITKSHIALAEVELAIARRNLKNATGPFEQGYVSREHYDELQDEVKRQNANLNILVKQLQSDNEVLAQRQYEDEMNYIKAPIDGHIVRRYANPGEGASTLNVSVMFEVEPDTNHIIRAEVSEQFISEVSSGQTVEFWPELFPNNKAQGKVRRISNIFGSRSLKFENAPTKTDERVIEVIIDIGDEKLLIGQRVMVKFLPQV